MNSNCSTPQWRNTSRAYGAISLSLHWLMALLIFFMFALGWGREFVPGVWKPIMMDAHKFIGILILTLVLFRLGWRLYTPPPPLPDKHSKLYAIAAHIAHGALYFFLFAMPISGWAMMSVSGRPVYVLDIISLPPLLNKSPLLVPMLKDSHEFMAYGFAALITAHTAAALFHHFILKDGIFLRISTFSKME